MPDDVSLIRRAQSGEKEAFRQLLEGHYAMIYRVAYRFTGHKSDAEDVAQDVCIALAQKLGSFKGDSAFTTWLYKIVLNACRDFIKKSSNRRRLESVFMDLEAARAEDARHTGKQVAWLYRAIAGMEPGLRETALLVLAEDMSHAEASRVLGCAESTISWRMHEIRKALKQGREGAA